MRAKRIAVSITAVAVMSAFGPAFAQVSESHDVSVDASADVSTRELGQSTDHGGPIASSYDDSRSAM